MPLKLLSPGGGSVLLQANTTSLDYTLTVPAETANLITTATTSGINASALTTGTLLSARLPSSGISATALTTGTVPTARLPTGSILQVVNVIKTDVFSTATTSFVDITGLSATITPISSSSKIMVTVSLGRVGQGDGGGGPHSVAFRLDRNGTSVFIGDASGSRARATFTTSTGYNGDHSHAYTFTGVDSPATTSSLTYKLQMFTQSNGTGYINRGKVDADNGESYANRTSSTITLMEIAG